MDQDSNQVAREIRETIHIRLNNPTLNCSTGKMYIPFLEQTDLPMNLTKWWTQTFHKVILISPFQETGSPEQCVWQIK